MPSYKFVLFICLAVTLPLSQTLKLGQTPLSLGPPLGGVPCALGTWSWGNKLLYEYDSSTDDSSILASYDAARSSGINLFDTGDSYGTGKLQGNAERLLKLGYDNEPRSIFNLRPPPIFLSKIAVYPWLLTSAQYHESIMSSRSRLGIKNTSSGPSPKFVPSIHWSPDNYNPFQTGALYEALARCYEEGNCDGVGLSNLGADSLLRACEFFQSRSVPIACNQIQCSLVSDFENDVKPALEVGNEAGVTTLGYSPLGLGLLAGESERTSRGRLRGFVFNKISTSSTGDELLKTVGRIAERKGCTESQVGLNWVKRKGLVVLFGARREERVEENVKGVNGAVELSDKEFEELEEARIRLKTKGTRNVFMTS